MFPLLEETNPDKTDEGCGTQQEQICTGTKLLQSSEQFGKKNRILYLRAQIGAIHRI